MVKRRLIMTATALCVLFLTGCGLDTVAKVKADPYQFTKKSAHLAGIVTKSFGVMGYGIYEIEDATGKIFVVSRGRGVPGKGAKIELRGKVQNAFSIAGFDYGVVVMEESRKLHD
jgi:hypothetical protein